MENERRGRKKKVKDPYIEKIRHKLRNIRISENISQKEVAESAGISIAAYSNIESGESQNLTIKAGIGIAKALNYDFNQLFEIKEYDYTPDQMNSLIKALEESEKELEKQVKNLEKELGYLSEANKRLKNENRFLYVEKLSFEFRYHLFTLYRNKVLMTGAEIDSKKREAIIKTVYEILARRVKEITEESIIHRRELLHIIYINDAFADYYLDKKTDFVKEYTKHLKNFMDTNENEIDKFLIWYDAVSSRSG